MFPNLKFQLLKRALKLLEVSQTHDLLLDDLTCSWHTFGGEERRADAITLFLFGWWKIKAIETLFPMGYL